MKPKNFPERKNQRRIDAIKRLQKAYKRNAKGDTLSIISNTKQRLINNARSIGTKKDRSKEHETK